MSLPEPPIRAAVTRARIDRVITRYAHLPDDHLETIEATLFEIGELRAACGSCGHLYRPYLRALRPLPQHVTRGSGPMFARSPSCSHCS